MRPQPLGIQRRTVTAVLGTALLVFVCFAVASVVYRSGQMKERVRELLAPYAGMITISSDVAVIFENSARATEILEALKDNPQILRADLVLVNGTTLATYPEGKPALEPAQWQRPDDVYLTRDTAALVQTLAPNKEHVAKLVIYFSLAKLQQSERQTLVELTLIVALILAVIVLLQFVLLQRWVLSPLTQLTEIAERAGSHGDYTLRAPTGSRDEFGQLGKNFNALLTAVEQREAALRRLSNFQRSILNDAAYAIISTDLHGVITSINPAGEKLTGWSAAELVGRQTPEVFHDAAEIAAHAEELAVELGEPLAPGFEVFVARARRGLPFEAEWTYVRKDGRRVAVLLSVTAQRDERGEIFGFLGNASDITERKATLDALATSERRLQHAFNATFDSIWEWNVVTNTTYYSPRWYQILGYADQSFPMTFETFVSLCHPDDLPPTMAAVQAVLQGGGPTYETEFRMRAKDGGWRWILGRGAVAETDVAGQVILLSGTNTDITEAKFAKLALAESESRFRQMFQTAPDSVFLVAADGPEAGQILSANEVAMKEHGYSMPELLAKKIWELDEPADADLALQRLQQFSMGVPKTFQVIHRRKDGSTFPVEVVAQKNLMGGRACILAFDRNITERLQSETALRDSESRFRELAESISEVFWIYELATNRTSYVSPAFERIWGFSRQVVLDDPAAWGRTIHPDDYAESKKTFELALAGKPPSSREYRIITGTGEVRWVRDRAFPIFDAAGQVVRVVGVVEDDTARKTAELLIEKRDLRLARIASRVPGVLYEFKLFPDGTSSFPYASDGLREVYRVTPEAVREDASPVFKVVHPDDLAQVKESIAASAKNLTQWQCEYRVWFPDGAVRWLLGNSIPEAQADGSVLWHGFITDITTQKQIQERLNEQHSKYQLLFENMTAGFALHKIICDAEGKPVDYRFLEVNPAFERITGLLAKNLVHHTVKEILPGTEHYWLEEFGRVALTGRPVALENYSSELQKYFSVWAFCPKPEHFAVVVSDITERKQYELELQEKNSLLDGTLQATADGILAVSGDGKVMSYNRQFVELWRVPPELLDLQDAEALALFVEQQINNPNFKVRQLNDTTKSETFDQLEFADGRVFERFSRPQIVAGRVVGRVWSFRDMTLRHWAVISLRESEQKFKTLFDTANDAILLLDALALHDCNQMAETMFGAPRKQLLGQAFGHFCPEHQADGSPSQASLNQKLNAVLAGQPQSFEWICCRADGTPFNAEISLNPLELRDVPIVQAIIRDITARKQSEAARREAEELYRTLINTSPDGIAVLNLEGNITFSSPKDLELYGHTSLATKLGHPALQFVSEADRARAGAALRDAAQGKIERSQRFQMMRLDGTQFVAEVDGALLRDDLGVPRGIMIITRDVTERQRQEDELKSKNAELERFTYTVSHDLKSPLITIKGFANGLLLDASAGRLERLGDDLKRIVLAADKMSELLNGLLELSRVGRILNPPTEVSMDKVVADVVELLSGSIKQRSAHVTVQPGLPKVHGDPQRLQTVLQNLVENALKFAQPGAVPVIEIGAATGAEKYFFVRDAGMGIEPRHQETVFGLFNKLDARSDGTGIGLALVRRIVEFHGGRIWVESAGTNQGATFCFSLPLSTAKSAVTLEAQS